VGGKLEKNPTGGKSGTNRGLASAGTHVGTVRLAHHDADIRTGLEYRPPVDGAPVTRRPKIRKLENNFLPASQKESARKARARFHKKSQRWKGNRLKKAGLYSGRRKKTFTMPRVGIFGFFGGPSRECPESL